jgi:hypothetical protein
MKHVVVLHETLHKLYRKKMSGAIFKIDFEKVYDKVNWTFLHETLQMKGFFPNMVYLDPIFCKRW